MASVRPQRTRQQWVSAGRGSTHVDNSWTQTLKMIVLLTPSLLESKVYAEHPSYKTETKMHGATFGHEQYNKWKTP